MIDKYDLMKSKMYSKVQILNSSNYGDIELNDENFIYLVPQKLGTFNRYNMEKL